MEKILVLGGTQFVGRQLVETLIEQSSYEIHLFNRGKTNPHLFPDTVHKIIGDRETINIAQIGNQDWDYIIDFSSYYPQSLKETLKHINKNLKAYIYISTISVYDFHAADFSVPFDEDRLLHTWTNEDTTDTSLKTYGKRKAACEKILSKTDGIHTIILRPSIIYGKYDLTDRLNYWLYRIQKGKPMILPAGGKHKISLTFADDLVAIILDALAGNIEQGIYNCSTHDPITLKSLIQLSEKVIGNTTEKCAIPQEYLLNKQVQPQQDIPLWFGINLMFDHQKIKNARAKAFSKLENSIRATVQYYEQQNWITPTVGLSLEQEGIIIEQFRKEN